MMLCFARPWLSEANRQSPFPSFSISLKPVIWETILAFLFSTTSSAALLLPFSSSPSLDSPMGKSWDSCGLGFFGTPWLVNLILFSPGKGIAVLRAKSFRCWRLTAMSAVPYFTWMTSWASLLEARKAKPLCWRHRNFSKTVMLANPAADMMVSRSSTSSPLGTPTARHTLLWGGPFPDARFCRTPTLSQTQFETHACFGCVFDSCLADFFQGAALIFYPHSFWQCVIRCWQVVPIS